MCFSLCAPLWHVESEVVCFYIISVTEMNIDMPEFNSTSIFSGIVDEIRLDVRKGNSSMNDPVICEQEHIPEENEFSTETSLQFSARRHEKKTAQCFLSSVFKY